LLHLYSAFLGTQSTMEVWISTTTNMQHPPGWSHGSHIAPEHPPAYWWRGDREIILEWAAM